MFDFLWDYSIKWNTNLKTERISTERINWYLEFLLSAYIEKEHLKFAFFVEDKFKTSCSRNLLGFYGIIHDYQDDFFVHEVSRILTIARNILFSTVVQTL